MAKSLRNKTIDTTVDEGREFLDKCLDSKYLIEAGQSGYYVNAEELLDKTILGDIIEIAQAIPENTADLIIADPPYNLTKKYASRDFNKVKNDEYEDYTYEWLQAIKHILKPTGSIYVCCDWESSLIIGGVLKDFFKIRNRITWQREKGRGSKNNWKNSMEDIWYATNSNEYTFNVEAVKVRRKVIAPYKQDGKPKDWTEDESGRYRDTYPSNFWDDISIPFWSMPENTAHPTQKPEKLIAKLILASSNEGDVVFDPFLGSGTSSVVAKKLGRHYIGIEREERFCVWAEQRLSLADNNKKIQGFVDGVFWERNSLRKK